MRLALLLGGPLLVTEGLRERLKAFRLWAADSGARHALELGLPLELWLGDMDSSPPWLQEALPAPRVLLPPEKDLTDGEALMRRALEAGPEEVLLLGATGGRLDHTLAHLELAFLLAERGIRVELSDGLTRTFPLLPGEHAFSLEAGAPFSLLPFPRHPGSGGGPLGPPPHPPEGHHQGPGEPGPGAHPPSGGEGPGPPSPLPLTGGKRRATLAFGVWAASSTGRATDS
jgi:thiamine pyrophosphokinase